MTPEELAKSGTEHAEQRALFAELAHNYRSVYDVTYAIPNGGLRDKRTAGKLKAEGVKSGVPDICVAWPFNGHHGLYIEMKRRADVEKDRRAGVLGFNQDPWHLRLRARGYTVVTCYGWIDAMSAIQAYFHV